MVVSLSYDSIAVVPLWFVSQSLIGNIKFEASPPTVLKLKLCMSENLQRISHHETNLGFICIN